MFWVSELEIQIPVIGEQQNTGRIFIAKNRNGPDGIVYPIFMDTSNVKIKILPSTGETPSSILVKNSKEQEDNLKKKYSKY